MQDRNILVTQKWAPVPPNPAHGEARPTCACTSVRRSTSVQEEGGWIFVKDGGAFAAVKVVAGGYQWTPAWKHADDVDKDNKAFITLDTENAPVILIANQAADYKQRFRRLQGRGEGPADPLRGRRPALCHDHLLRPVPSPAR